MAARARYASGALLPALWTAAPSWRQIDDFRFEAWTCCEMELAAWKVRMYLVLLLPVLWLGICASPEHRVFKSKRGQLWLGRALI